MRFEDCRVGMEVVFGRGNGEFTRGVVTKTNRVKAKVRTNENRGKTAAGTVWSVPYSLMEPANGSANTNTFSVQPTPVNNIADQPIEYSPFQNHSDVLILEAISCVYNELSPENLCCDGELPTHLVHRKRGSLNSKLDGLFKAFGRPVSEDVVWKWSEQRRVHNENRRTSNG